jgi:adenosylhomocysteine nucleosidase
VTAPSAPTLIVVSGLRVEARIVAGAATQALAGGGDPARLEAQIVQAAENGGCALLSFGLAAGLDPGLAPGSIVIPREVVHGPRRYATDHAWSQRLRRTIAEAVATPVAGVDGPLVKPRDKYALHEATHAAAADMESHVAARVAQRLGLPFAVLRVVGDPVQRAIPDAAVAGMRSDGRVHPVAVLASLLRNPLQLPTLIAVAADVQLAMQTLRRCRARLGPALGWVGPDSA